MISPRNLLSTALFASFLALAAPFAGATVLEGGPAAAPAAGATINHAINGFLTARGQRYFYDHLKDVVFKNGYAIDEASFEKWAYTAEEPFVLGNLPVRYLGFQTTFGAVREIMKKWLKGFELNDPKFSVEVKEILYQADFTRFGLRPDAEATRAAGGSNSVVVVFEAEAPSIRIGAASVIGTDLANPFLKTFGMDHLFIGLKEDSVPLRIQVPVQLRITSEGGIDMNVLAFRSNFDQVSLDLGYDTPLHLPQVELIINNRVFPLNQRTLEAKLAQHQAELIKAGQMYLKEHAEIRIPEVANKVAKEKLPHGFYDVNEMNPPGIKNVGPGDKFKWGIAPSELRLERDHLYLGLSGWVEDPKAAVHGRSPYYGTRRGLPTLTRLDPANYDLAFTLSQDLINRTLELSYQRGYFNTVDTGGNGASMRLMRRPVIRMEPGMAPNQAKLHLRIQQRVSGLKKLVVHDPFELELDMNVRLVSTATGSLSLVIDSIDENSIRIEDRYIKIGLFRGSVFKSARKTIREANKGFRNRAVNLVDNMPIPSQIGGIPIRVRDFQSDPAGYLVLYLELKRGR